MGKRIKLLVFTLPPDKSGGFAQKAHTELNIKS